MDRRIAIRLNKKETLVNLTFNHSYARRINEIVTSQNISKSKFALQSLQNALQTTSIPELKERIEYGANINFDGNPKYKASKFCKMIIKRSVDSY